MISPSEFNKSLVSDATACGFEATRLTEVNGSPINALTRRPIPGSGADFHLYLSSGVHGDEPAGPLALQTILRNDLLPRDIAISVLPLINPTGFEAQTRENANGYDLNRDFRTPANPETLAVKKYIEQLPAIDLSIALHEDWESSGFYMYALSPHPAEPVFRAILSEVAKTGPIETATLIDESEADRGLIYRPILDLIETRQDWPEAFLLYSKNNHIHLTTETPSSLPLDARIDLQIAATLSAINHIRSPLPPIRPE